MRESDESSRKKIKKPLDKLQKMRYNKDTKGQERKKEIEKKRKKNS